MRYDGRTRRRLTWALLPFRAGVCGWALWAAWHIYDRNVAQADYSDVALPLAFALVNGLLAGAVIVMAVMVAVFVWYPLPPPD